ncbi:unnamed protein product [Mytilus edulis]|uniref:C-terminal of Roc (COR) domain-containing protein n=1 Tax=Mytilus edulis TaxID=6550 RepID=A0A8S3QLE1_MYTED|nr:unnamed protein product [Mytilus edulis]
MKALFKQPLTTETVMEGLNVQFECETEEDSSSVQWFKDDTPITFDTENVKMETLPGHIYKLSISPASLQDSGRYRIEKNMIRSEAILDVKEMPETIKQMSDHDREEFLKATQSGTSKRYNVRVMIVGKGQVGKTCLLRRLMKEQIDDVKSTDGLDIVRKKCQINVDTGEWDLSTPGKDPYCIWSGQNEQFADCGFWDFAGQKEFYATHQTFLSSSAVYLLVVDISEEFKEKTYNRMIEESYDSIGEYIEFWLDNIHCYSTEVDDGSIQYNTNLDLNPPVIIVCTGIDKIQSAAIEERKQNFHDYLGKTLSLSAKRRHLREVHILSNEIPSDYGEEFERLRKDIFDKARTLKNWGDNLPTRWLVLEKEIYTKISVGIYTLSYNEAIKLAMDCSFPNLKQTTSELDSFLKYEHDIGNIIFFEDVKDFIVLDPKWLVDVFKCFVSHQYKRELINMPEWSELEKKWEIVR